MVVPSAPRSHAVSAQDLETLGGLVKECACVITVSAVNNVARHPSRHAARQHAWFLCSVLENFARKTLCFPDICGVKLIVAASSFH